MVGILLHKFWCEITSGYKKIPPWHWTNSDPLSLRLVYCEVLVWMIEWQNQLYRFAALSFSQPFAPQIDISSSRSIFYRPIYRPSSSKVFIPVDSASRGESFCTLHYMLIHCRSSPWFSMAILGENSPGCNKWSFHFGLSTFLNYGWSLLKKIDVKNSADWQIKNFNSFD